MSDDIRELLSATARPPTHPINAAGLVRRARRQRHGLRAVSTTAAAIVLVLAAVGIGQLWPGSAPEVANTPPEGPGIGILNTPRQPQDAVPENLIEQLGLEPAWAATSRLAREGDAYDYYVFRNDGSPSERGQDLCLLIAPHQGGNWTAGCSSANRMTDRHPVVTVSNGEVTAGLVLDGIGNAAELDEPFNDLPVVNNVFTTEE